MLVFLYISSKLYDCVSHGHAAALKLVGEGFPWTRDSCFAYTRDNHNSVLGIREQVRGPGRLHLADATACSSVSGSQVNRSR